MRRLFACALPLLLVASAAGAQSASPPTAPATPIPASKALQDRANDVVAMLGGKGDYDAIFAPSFREKIPKATFDAVTGRLSGGGGAVTGIEQLTADSPTSGTLLVGYTRGVATMRIAVDPAEPHQVVGLLVSGMTAREASLDAVLGALATLPGTTGFALARLDGAAPGTILAHNADRDFAIGSAFKLVILSELVRAVTAGERHWDDPVTLDGAQLPGGLYAAKPVGTKVSIRELAGQMISISDNSATDILLRTLGREKVEAMLPVVGFHSAARDRPFLSTLEMFKLKGIAGGALGARYLALDEKGRRALIEGEVRDAPLSAINPKLFADGKPQSIDTIEWFASPLDLVRVMDWLRRNTETGPAAEARAILAKNTGVGPVIAGGWRYLGYKGGSEPGVINMTFLLQGKDGGWYGLTGSWNDTAAPIDESRFASLMGRAAELAAPR
jgi:hypothetical protein